MSSIDGSGVHLGIDRKFYNEAMEQPWESDFLALARLSLSLRRSIACLSVSLPSCLPAFLPVSGFAFIEYRMSLRHSLKDGRKEGVREGGRTRPIGEMEGGREEGKRSAPIHSIVVSSQS